MHPALVRGNGLFARTAGAFSSWTRLAYPSPAATQPVQMPIVRSYCFTGDRWCQKGTDSSADSIHASYASRSTYDGYAFIRSWLISYSRATAPTIPVVPEVFPLKEKATRAP
jgi:hypothetical protein